MKTAGEKIFHIVRVFEETDNFGRVINVTDEVEVYHGRWGDDDAFNTFTTENKVDLLTKALAAQIDKNQKLLDEYNKLLEDYNSEVNQTNEYEKEILTLKAERDELQTLLDEYSGNTYDGTILSTDTKYIALENSKDGAQFTEEQYKSAMSELLEKGSVDLSDSIEDETEMRLRVLVGNSGKINRVEKLKVNIKKNGANLGESSYGEGNEKDVYTTIRDNDIFIFNIESKKDGNGNNLFTGENPVLAKLSFIPNDMFKGTVTIDDEKIGVLQSGKISVKEIKVPGVFTASVSFSGEDGLTDVSGLDSIGTLLCSIVDK